MIEETASEVLAVSRATEVHTMDIAKRAVAEDGESGELGTGTDGG